ncbi:class I SAM-dependent methyltransferase [Sphaerisporangium corydalis]|uniref:Class I SAM-dependent methyltransferase n=1 Tax=Sphaerisporangium corydalis TaxID=1441875 RepID=A0ABV9EPD4_9ACTN|nr:class I SAM-dependent methyltransferase [Sphaerisporangium corydalis]
MSHEVFDRVAEAYDAARPGYPDGLYDALAALSGVALGGATVVDVGAGTGISTRGLLARGARVVAVDPGRRMLARLVARTASPRVAVGDGNALPLRSGTADLVCFAQAWHWLRPEESIREAVRVLRPGGSVAAWWNSVDIGPGSTATAADWLVAHEVRMAEACSGYRGPALPEWSVPPVAAVMTRAGLPVQEAWIHWTRTVGVEDFLLDLRSHSFVASLGAGRVESLIGRERTELTRVFAQGELTVPMRVYLAIARKAGA